MEVLLMIEESVGVNPAKTGPDQFLTVRGKNILDRVWILDYSDFMLTVSRQTNIH